MGVRCLLPLFVLGLLLGSASRLRGQEAPPELTALLVAGAHEDAVLWIWNARHAASLEPASRAAGDSVVAGADEVLRRHDPLHARRGELWQSIGKRLAATARGYVRRKWYRTASRLLDEARRYDPAAAARELRQLGDCYVPAGGAGDTEMGGTPARDLLTRAATHAAHGDWQARDGALWLGKQDGDGHAADWIIAQEHADGEFVVEFRSQDAGAFHDFGITVGYGGGMGPGHRALRLMCTYDPARAATLLHIWLVEGNGHRRVAQMWGPASGAVDGFRRLVVRVEGKRAMLQLDDLQPLGYEHDQELCGYFGLVAAAAVAMPAIEVRSIVQRPLPVSPEADAANVTQRIDQVLARVASLADARDKEGAALELQQARVLVQQLPDDPLRARREADVRERWQRLDRGVAKWLDAQQACAGELAELAARHQEEGRTKLAAFLRERAVTFDPSLLRAAAEVPGKRDR